MKACRDEIIVPNIDEKHRIVCSVVRLGITLDIKSLPEGSERIELRPYHRAKVIRI